MTVVRERHVCDRLDEVEELLIKGDFEKAIRINEDILRSSPSEPPADSALFSLGMIWAHNENPKKDYRKALQYFNRLVEEFPGSTLTSEARIWAGVLGDINRVIEIDILSKVQALLAKDDFEGAMKMNEDILRSSPKTPPADSALFAMGLISVHHKNPKKDYRKALEYFKRVVEEFPASPLAPGARIWTGVLEDINKAVQIDLEIEEQKKELLR